MTRIVRWAPAVMVFGLFFAPVTAAAQEAFRLSELSEKPSIKSPQQAQRAIARTYPRDMQREGIGGTARIQFIVDVDGRVSADSVEILGTSRETFGEAAARAIADIEFFPARRTGARSVRSS